MATKKPTAESYLTISEAAKVVGVTRAAIHAAIQEKRLRATKGSFELQRVITRRVKGWCIKPEDLRDYQKEMRKAGRQPGKKKTT